MSIRRKSEKSSSGDEASSEPATIRVIGVDEAGYGPKLGPLVIAATAWEVPVSVGIDGLAEAFAGIVSSRWDRDGSTIHIADSKQVHQSGMGIGRLERSALALLELIDQRPGTLRELWGELDSDTRDQASQPPWFQDGDCALPAGDDFSAARPAVAIWKERCIERGCRLVRCESAIIPAGRFNEHLARCETKGRLLSELSLRLVRRLWTPHDRRPTVILCDKHGGRNRYANLLAESFSETFPLVLDQGRACSRYRLGRAEFRFQARSETHFPVACASIIAKYLRELAMDLFNAYWARMLPGLKPTRGYPVDAARFLEAIAPHATEIGLARETFWRAR